ncbi:DUF1573 domain-containing protein [Fulvivirga lutimaris]|uniref:DUF1573 domain-containing protein n=1 Tax=Fulvivirga lutimaris TaxID=1819566 RepID=UPI001FEAB8FC|nr:DUF1573 domain-containing protein [Fulvivirga lutimaris]
MRLLLLSFIVFSSLTTTLNAQQVEPITFSEKSFDFGNVKEVDGPITHEFTFTNNSQEPIRILNVKASCGCTTPAWTRDSIAPGNTGYIQAQYNPRNRPGVFNKSLTITTSLGETLRLYIRGEVEPKVLTIEEKLRTEMGGIRMKYPSVNLGKVYINKPAAVRKYDIYNQTDVDITFSDDYAAPDHIKVSFEPKTLGSKSSGYLVVTYDAAVKNDYGFMNDRISFQTNEPEDKVKELTVYATIEDYFAPIPPEELSEVPRLKIENSVYDFGRVSKEKESKYQFVVKNTGNSDLTIKKISPNCTCVTGVLSDEVIKPGGQANLDVTFNPEGRRGNQQKSITLYSNDPKSSAQRITIKAYVQE